MHERASRAASDIARQLTMPRTVPTPAQSLSGGAAGIALMHIERAIAGTTDWHDAHDWLAAAAADGGVTIGSDACLYHGAPALAFAPHPAPQPGYAPAQGKLDEAVSVITRSRLAAASQRIARGERPALRNST